MRVAGAYSREMPMGRPDRTSFGPQSCWIGPTRLMCGGLGIGESRRRDGEPGGGSHEEEERRAKRFTAAGGEAATNGGDRRRPRCRRGRVTTAAATTRATERPEADPTATRPPRHGRAARPRRTAATRRRPRRSVPTRRRPRRPRRRRPRRRAATRRRRRCRRRTRGRSARPRRPRSQRPRVGLPTWASSPTPRRGGGSRWRPRVIWRPAVRALARHGHVPRRRRRLVQHVRPEPHGRAARAVQADLPRAARRVRPAPQGDHHRVLLPPHPGRGGADRHRPRRRSARGRARVDAEGPAARGHPPAAEPADGKKTRRRANPLGTSASSPPTSSTPRRPRAPRSTSSRPSATRRTGRPRSSSSTACTCTTRRSSSSPRSRARSACG